MSERKYPRRSDSRKRNDEPELILDTDEDTYDNHVNDITERAKESPSVTLAEETMSMQTSRKSEVFGNEFFEIRERFFRVVDSRPDMKPHDLKCILWDMLPPYDDEYPSQTATRLIGKMDDLYKRMCGIETCMSPNGDFGRAVRVTQRKVDKIQGTTEYILDIAKGEAEAVTMADKFNPVIGLMVTTTNNCQKKLEDAAKDIRAAISNADKLNNRVSVPLTSAIMYWVITIAFGLFQLVATLGYLIFGMTLSDLAWMLCIAPAIIAVGVVAVKVDHRKDG